MITHSHTTTVDRTPLYEGSACRRDLYLTTHHTHNRQTSMLPATFEPAILAGDQLQTHCSATGIGKALTISDKLCVGRAGKGSGRKQMVVLESTEASDEVFLSEQNVSVPRF